MTTRPTRHDRWWPGDRGSGERGPYAPFGDGDPEAGDAQAAAIAGIHAEDLADVDDPGDGPDGIGARVTVTDLAGPDLSGLGPGLGAPLDQRE